MNKNVETLFRQIDNIQKLKGLNDKQLAESLGIDSSTVSKIKHGIRQPGRKFIQALSRVYPELRMDIYQYISSGGEET